MLVSYHYDFSIKVRRNQHRAAKCILFHTVHYLYAIAVNPPPVYILNTVSSIEVLIFRMILIFKYGTDFSDDSILLIRL